MVALDLLVQRAEGGGRAAYLRWARLALVTLAGFAAAEGVRAVLAFALLPTDIAWDVVWPAFAGRYYATIPGEIRWPLWVNARFFVGQQLTPAVGLAFSAAGLLRLVASPAGGRDVDLPRRHDRAALLLLPLFYLLCSTAYFGHVHNFYQYAWCLVLGVPYTLARLGAGVKVAAAAGLPCALLMTKATFLPPPRSPASNCSRSPTGRFSMLPPRRPPPSGASGENTSGCRPVTVPAGGIGC